MDAPCLSNNQLTDTNNRDGLFAGQSRTTTTDYTCLLVMSVLIAVTLHVRFNNLNLLYGEDNRMLAVGFIMPMVISLIVAKKFIRPVRRHDFTFSALYSIGLDLLAST